MEAVAITKSVEEMFAVATQSKGWLKFLGVLSIIGGVLSALTIVGILVAWLPIWMGVLLFQAGSQADAMATTAGSQPARRHAKQASHLFCDSRGAGAYCPDRRHSHFDDQRHDDFFSFERAEPVSSAVCQKIPL